MLMDCCHSGTINRFGFGEPPSASGVSDERSRFIALSEDLKQAYLDFARSKLSAGRALAHSRSRAVAKAKNEVLFSACLSSEVAWESNGQGDFTVRANDLLAQAAGRAFTNKQFIDAVVAAFGANPRQTPNITCDPKLYANPLFGAPNGAGGRASQMALDTVSSDAASTDKYGKLADAIGRVADELRQL
jgi:hypothetical protein